MLPPPLIVIRRMHVRNTIVEFILLLLYKQQEPCDSLAIPPQKWKNENQDLWVSVFRNAKCNVSYLFWESACRYLTFLWHFEMLMKCNANISISGAMQNVNEMQM